LAAAIAIPAAAQVACTPVLVLVFGQLSPYAIPANVVAALAVVPATILGVLAAVVAAVSVAAAAPIAWLAALPTWLVAAVARTFAAFPDAGLRWSGKVGLGLALAFVVVVIRSAQLVSRRTKKVKGSSPVV
jgi:competence protein ComEC